MNILYRSLNTSQNIIHQAVLGYDLFVEQAIYVYLIFGKSDPIFFNSSKFNKVLRF